MPLTVFRQMDDDPAARRAQAPSSRSRRGVAFSDAVGNVTQDRDGSATSPSYERSVGYAGIADEDRFKRNEQEGVMPKELDHSRMSRRTVLAVGGGVAGAL